MVIVMNMDIGQLTRGNTQTELLQCLLQHKDGLSIEGLVAILGISRNAVRQHLTALERDGMVAKGAMLPSGGRPQQAFVLGNKGREIFQRQYSWFADMLISDLLSRQGTSAVDGKLADMGRAVGEKLSGKLKGRPRSVERLQQLAEEMSGLGYHAHFQKPENDVNAPPEIIAYNCVFHEIATQHPSVCKFDIALIESATGSKIDHASCMLRGGTCCRFIMTDRD